MTQEITNYTKYPELDKFITILRENGFTVILNTYSDKKPTWLHFSKDDNIGYVQYDGYRVSFSTVHKPNRNTGTGFGLGDYADLTVENALNSFMIAPDWARYSDRSSVVKYSTLQEFIKKLESEWHNRVTVLKNISADTGSGI